MYSAKQALKPVPANAKWTFTTRRVKRADIHGLSTVFAAAVAGDLLLARVARLGQHKKLQLASGRYSESHLDDVAVLCVGDRYAPDQFEGYADIDQAGCDLVAGGGVAGRVVHAHEQMSAPTRLEPLGLLTNTYGDVVNIASYALPRRPVPADITVIGVFGTSMNSGKTTTAASLAHGLMKAGLRVAGIKATGTGAFGDFNAFRDAGVPISDFTDAGMPTTYRMPPDRIEAGFEALVGAAAANGAEVAVVEFADGIFQRETQAILADSPIRERLDGVVFASADAAGAVGAVSILRQLGHAPLFLSGLLSRSPLASREAADVTDLPVLTRQQLHEADVVAACIGPVMRRADAGLEVAA